MATKTLVDLDSTQTLTNKTLTAPTLTSAVVALAAAPTATLDAATKGYVDGLNINPLNNGSLAATVASNILTLSLKTAGGAAPSAGDPVRVTFRNATDADGSLVTRTVTSATSMTFASGSTLGMTNAVAARIWVGLLDNSGTVEVCAWNSYKTSGSPAEGSLKGFTPNTDVTTTAEGSGTATSAHVLYSSNARSSVPFVLLGFIEISEATAGVWATAPTVVQTYRDGLRKTGDFVQRVSVVTGAVATGTTTIPIDDTIPQNTEGDQYLTVTAIPTSAINLLKISTLLNTSHSAAPRMISALFKDAVANALTAGQIEQAVALRLSQVSMNYESPAGTVSSTTFNVRAGGSSAGTLTVNGESSTRIFGGVCHSYINVEEIYV